MIRPNNFMDVCPECKGEKLVEDWDWRKWRAKHKERYQSLIKHGKKHGEAWTQAAEETGPTPDCPEEMPCNYCDGIGMVATAEGQELLRFLGVFA